ncbi:MAG: hypothetical protein HY315_05625 [Acidobacteria bacterium]|nr:hypothetical protein [Acidobacteriota bacterium]
MELRNYRILILALILSGSAPLLAEDKAQTWTGEISDDMCLGDHAAMGGKSARDCTIECVKSMGSKYALVVDKNTHFQLSDQKAPESFAGKKAKVTGILDSKTKVIRVQKIEAAQ